MNKNYYKILEIDKNASKEVIEKVYKILVKKYHPDLQSETNKQFFENKLKSINEAYDVLSDPNKKKQYDSEFEFKEFNSSTSISNKDFQNVVNENIKLKNIIKQLKEIQSPKTNNDENIYYYNDFSNQNHINQDNYNKQEFRNNLNSYQYNQQMNDAINESINKAYYDAYIQDLKNKGYKIRYKKHLKDYINNFLALIITICILFLVFQIPFIKNYFINLYNTNIIIKSIINFFINIFT